MALTGVAPLQVAGTGAGRRRRGLRGLRVDDWGTPVKAVPTVVGLQTLGLAIFFGRRGFSWASPPQRAPSVPGGGACELHHGDLRDFCVALEVGL